MTDGNSLGNYLIRRAPKLRNTHFSAVFILHTRYGGASFCKFDTKIESQIPHDLTKGISVFSVFFLYAFQRFFSGRRRWAERFRSLIPVNHQNNYSIIIKNLYFELFSVELNKQDSTEQNASRGSSFISLAMLHLHLAEALVIMLINH